VNIAHLPPDAINGELRVFLKIHHPDRTHSPTGRPIRCVGKRLPHELDVRGKDPFRFTFNAERKTETPTVSGGKRR
jgi:hypothetical protein